jgi:predicted phage terminase large subunit-like protein
VIDTPLALHHVVMCNAMQLMAQGLLFYDRASMASPVDWGLLRGEVPQRFQAVADGPFKPPAGVGNETRDSIEVGATPTDFKIPNPFTADALESDLIDFPAKPVSADPKSAKNTGVVSEFIQHPQRYTDEAHEVRVCLHGVLTGRISPGEARMVVERHYGGLDICRRVMLMMPPGSAKSTYASVVFPTWVMGEVGAFEVILTGWGDPICRRHGKRARQICSSAQYRALFSEQVDPNTRAAEDWQLTNFSSYKSSGIQAGISGFRTHGLIWDDMIKGRQDADSPTVRERVWNEYVDSARSRKTPKAWEVGVGTRWHEDEHMGKILPQGYNGASGFMEGRDGNVWLVLCFAAECERLDDPLGRNPGDMIWDEWFDEEYWQDKRRNPRSWASLYQQRPAPEEGLVFQRDKFKYWDVLPEGDDFISYDPGVSEIGDATAMHRWRVDNEARLYLVERYYAQVGMDVWIQQLIHWVKKCKHLLEAVSESGVIKRAAEPFIKRAMRHEKAFFNQTWVTRSANKTAMAAPAIAMVNSGQVFVPRNSDGEDFIASCLRFPGADDDHDVDSFANLCLRLEAIWEKSPKIKESEKPAIIGGTFGGQEMKVKSFMPPRISKRTSRWTKRTSRKHG